MKRGQRHSEETKNKISAAKLGKTFTPEHSLAISNSLKGRKKSAQHKLAIAKGIRAARANRVLDTVTDNTQTSVA